MEPNTFQLLSEEELYAAPYYTSLEKALSEREKCFKLRLLRSEDATLLAEALPQLPFVQHLYFDYHESLEEVPESVGLLWGLQELKVRACNFKSFHPALMKLENLRLVDFERCQGLTSFPDFLEGTQKLKFLRFSECPITELPDFIGQNSAMETLVLRKTKVESLPDSVSNFVHLQMLHAYPATMALSVPIGLKNCQSLESFIHARLDVRGGTEADLKSALPNTQFDLIP